MDIRWTRAAAQAAGTLAAAGALWSAADAAPPSHAQARRDVYGIVNLAPPPVYRAFINARSQVAFEYTGPDDSPHVGFFDGQRVVSAEPAGARGSLIANLNDRGEVAAHAVLPDVATFVPYRWTQAAGPTLLPDPHPGADTFTSDINNRGQIVGFSQQVDLPARWDGANRLVPLQLPAGYAQSIAYDINESNISAGVAAAPDGDNHSVLWDAAGRLVDLGTFGANSSFALQINDRNEVGATAVTVDAAGNQYWRSLLWNRRAGAAFVSPPGSQSVIAALNERSEAVGRLLPPVPARVHALYFSRQRGLVDLHRAPFVESNAYDINDTGTIIGSMTRANPDGSETELAHRWSNFSPVNLNTRLLDAPDGLVLTTALHISPSGDIVANSNAGLVLLRQGRAGTDAPVLGPVALAAAIEPGVAATLTQTFSDRNPRDTHAATVNWGDGSGPQTAIVDETRGRGSISATHTYAASGNFTIVVNVTDSTGKTTSTFRLVTVEPPRPFAGEGKAAAQPRRTLFGPETPAAVQARLNRLPKK